MDFMEFLHKRTVLRQLKLVITSFSFAMVIMNNSRCRFPKILVTLIFAWG